MDSLGGYSSGNIEAFMEARDYCTYERNCHERNDTLVDNMR